MPATSRRTTDLKMPVKNDATHDKRYRYPQFVKKTDGKRDMRTTPTSKRKTV
jgi:hypothetical protein